MKYALTDTISEILGAPVNERSQNAMVRCPFHVDDHPSLSIDLDRGLWVCFGCGEKGGIQKLAFKMEHDIDETDVMLRALERAANSPYYEEAPDFTEKAERLHRNVWEQKPTELVEYIVSRGLDGMAVRHFKMGWDGRRIALPYWDDEKCIGIKYRDAQGNKSSETGTKRYIYNVNDVRGKEVVLVCEGESDTHAVWSAIRRADATVLGHVGVCGIPGATVSKSQWAVFATEFLWSKRVAVLFDNDTAGAKGAAVALDILGEKGAYVPPVVGKDWAEYLMKVRPGGLTSALQPAILTGVTPPRPEWVVEGAT